MEKYMNREKTEKNTQNVFLVKISYLNYIRRKPRYVWLILILLGLFYYHFLDDQPGLNITVIKDDPKKVIPDAIRPKPPPQTDPPKALKNLILKQNQVPPQESTLKIINKLVTGSTFPDTFEQLLQESFDPQKQKGLPALYDIFANQTLLLNDLKGRYNEIQVRRTKKRGKGTFTGNTRDSRLDTKKQRTRITVALISCGSRDHEMTIMLKSLALFSQDAALHVIVFTDGDAVINIGVHILELKWVANLMGWDVTFEMHLVWFPSTDDLTKNITGAVDWKAMYTKCATQRLFFPTLLPHIDSLIYMDTDVLTISNLTELWLEFRDNMGDTKMAAATGNTEGNTASMYRRGGHVPYFGKKGFNAGVLLMNLTQMRKFKFQEKSIGAHALYEEKIKLADQDIINIVFSVYPDRAMQLNCTYNFNWIHCGVEGFKCHNEATGENSCFCETANLHGVRIIHGNSGTFNNYYKEIRFFPQVFSAFEKFDLLIDSPIEMVEDLIINFNNLTYHPCRPLTADGLYGNAYTYFKSLKHNNNNVYK